MPLASDLRSAIAGDEHVTNRDIVVIGASAGGIDALKTIASGLPSDFPASIFVVLHTSPDSPGVLAAILDRAGVLPATNAQNHEKIRSGRIYVAPPDRHLILEPGKMVLARGPRENRFRPAVDPLFRSAAQTYGPRVIGVILTGGLDDGTSGLWTVKQLGGTTIVQDPNDALAPSMPESALRNVRVDYTLPVNGIAEALIQLTAGSLAAQEEGRPVPEKLKIEVAIAKEDGADEAGVFKLGEPSRYACPECHGVLLQVEEGESFRFRCHTGHAYSIDSLLSEIDDAVEDALWNAIRSIQERAMLLDHVAEHVRQRDGDERAAELKEHAAATRKRADVVRNAVIHDDDAKPERGRVHS
jgi:two-component system chemotaxis response regulator CheB